LIAKGEIEEDGICAIIIISGEEDLLHFGEGNFQMDSLTLLSFWSFEGKLVCFNPQPALPSRPFNRKPTVVVSVARFRCHHDEI